MNLALKYRPTSLKELLGQDVLVTILKNSLQLDKVPTSILLVGNSGVGKTTTARIIALSLNCTNGTIEEPCGTCYNCIAIKTDSHPDVIEIDAASNTGIEDIKVILDNSHYLPSNSKYKTYIIDEAHMLSISAFNALLKTLEEPSKYVKFILATTEARKIPDTVISRCLRFNLKQITPTQIIEHLSFVAKKEGITYDSKSLQLIAYHSEGSMRNALTILEQAALYNSYKEINVQTIHNLIGYIDRQVLFALLCSITDSKPADALEKFENILQNNNPISILENLLTLIHEITYQLITRVKTDNDDIEYIINKSPTINKRISSTLFLSRLWQSILKGVQEIKTSACIYTSSKMIIIRLCYLSDLPSPEQIIKKLHSPTSKVLSSSSINDNEIFNNILNILLQKKQITLYNYLINDVELISCGEGFLILKAKNSVIDGLTNDLTQILNKVTGKKWLITIQQDNECNDLYSHIKNNPAVQSVISHFEGAKIVDVSKNNK